MKVVKGWAAFTGPGNEPGVVKLSSIVSMEEEIIWDEEDNELIEKKRVVIHLENKLFIDKKHTLKEWCRAVGQDTSGGFGTLDDVFKVDPADPLGSLLSLLDQKMDPIFAPVAPPPDLGKMAKGVKDK